MIRIAKLSDIGIISQIHLQTLPNDLLPRLGFDFLKSYYFNLIQSEYALIIVNDDNEEVNSFVVFAFNTFQLSKLIKKDKIFLGYSILKASLKSPKIILAVINFIFGKEIYKKHINQIETSPELYSIATMDSYKNKGIGKRITLFGLKILKEKTKREGCLVKTSSIEAKRFYEKNGFIEVGETIRGNNKLFILFVPFKEIQ